MNREERVAFFSNSLNKEESPFKDNRGRLLTTSLFHEFKIPAVTPIYTLRENDFVDDDGNELKSLKRLYLEERDVVEISFAKKYLYSWQHWKRLCENKQLAVHIEEWREELEILLRSEALSSMINTALYEGSKGTTAAKFIVEKGWTSKAKKQEELKAKEKVQEAVEDNIHMFLQRVK